MSNASHKKEIATLQEIFLVSFELFTGFLEGLTTHDREGYGPYSREKNHKKWFNNVLVQNVFHKLPHNEFFRGFDLLLILSTIICHLFGFSFGD